MAKKGILDMVVDSIFDEQWIGRYGEKLTQRELNLVKLLGRKGKVLRNVYVPKDDGETSEIDVIFVTQKGVFVIESKNYAGWIFGNEKDGYWTQVIEGGIKNRFYNPIKQNKTHIKWLGEYLGGQVPLFSIVAFSERCTLKKVTLGTVEFDVKKRAACSDESGVWVINRDRLYATVRELWDPAEDVMNEADVSDLHEKLKALTRVSKQEKKAHVESIEKRYKKKAAEEEEKNHTNKTVEINEEETMKTLFICYPRCTTCQKARKWMDDNGVEYTERHIAEENPSADELRKWIRASGLPVRKFFNTTGVLYRQMSLKDKLPDMSDDEKIELLATDGFLVKRPLLISAGNVLVGFKEAEWEVLK